MIEFDEYKVKLNNIRPKLDALADSLGIEAAKEEIDRLHAQIDSEGFWDNQEISQKVMKQSRTLEAKVARYEKMCSQWDDLYTLCEMALEDNDDSMLPELTEGYAQLEQEMENARLETLLSGEYDNNNAIVSFQAGAGGTEAQDWASMLYRMYTHWTEQHGLTYKILDYLDGDEAGIKSASILIEGENAYGMLKSEQGVHRLVRISPTDAKKRRQTTFGGVEVLPVLPDDIEVEIDEGDLRIDVYHSSGHGGQGVNTTDSAVRVTHFPSGIVVTCQNERSQIQNKAACMQILKARLYEIELEKRAEALDEIRGPKTTIGFGNQIRSYVLYPYQMVKDLRTGVETSNVEAVLDDGDLDPFVIGYHRWATGNADAEGSEV